jgi:hypothetical protein
MTRDGYYTTDELYERFRAGDRVRQSRAVKDGSPRYDYAIVLPQNAPEFVEKYNGKYLDRYLCVIEDDGTINGWCQRPDEDNSSLAIELVSRVLCSECDTNTVAPNDYLCPTCRSVLEC